LKLAIGLASTTDLPEIPPIASSPTAAPGIRNERDFRRILNFEDVRVLSARLEETLVSMSYSELRFLVCQDE
jgi:hypothetical protein